MNKVFSVLSGAYVNAGDFLIVHRTIALLKYIFPGCEIKEYKRNKRLDKYLDEINQSDALIIAGGPAYLPNMYPEVLPLVDDLDRIKTKIVAIGLGWYGKNATYDFIKNYKFSKKTRLLLDRIVKDCGCLSCRDWHTVRALNYNGYHKAILTGCPAWYCLDNVDNTTLRTKWEIPRKICISDPADEMNFKEAVVLAKHIKNKFSDSEVISVFHRVDEKNNKYSGLINEMKKTGIAVKNITGAAEGFSVYDDCDLHIGYRVHAHIYNLSKQNVSILVEEDGRGAGVNDALGIQGIKSFNSTRVKISGGNYWAEVKRSVLKRFILNRSVNDEYICREYDNYIHMLLNNDFSQYSTAFGNINYYFKVMTNYIKGVIK